MSESLGSVQTADPRDDAITRGAQISLGGLVLDLALSPTVTGLRIYGTHVPFLTNGQPIDCTLRTHILPIPDLEWGREIFVSTGLWSLYRSDGHYVIPFRSPRTGPKPYRLATFNDDFGLGELYVPPRDRGVRRGVPEPFDVTVDPLLPPIDELIVVNLLSRGRGLYVHACGVSDGQRSVAFCGVSGSGKSTIARLWKKHPVIVQSDDRLILRPVDDRIWAWGTPWHGDAGTASPLSAPLVKLYFITHGKENRITPLTPSEAARRLMVRCFPTYYDAEGMAFTLEIISRTCSLIPCAELAFVPDERVVELAYRDSLAA